MIAVVISPRSLFVALTALLLLALWLSLALGPVSLPLLDTLEALLRLERAGRRASAGAGRADHRPDSSAANPAGVVGGAVLALCERRHAGAVSGKRQASKMHWGDCWRSIPVDPEGFALYCEYGIAEKNPKGQSNNRPDNKIYHTVVTKVLFWLGKC